MDLVRELRAGCPGPEGIEDCRADRNEAADEIQRLRVVMDVIRQEAQETARTNTSGEMRDCGYQEGLERALELLDGHQVVTSFDGKVTRVVQNTP